jgi:hypothetical protein
MRIPEIRDRLLQIAAMHRIPEIERLAHQLTRRAPKRMAPRSSEAMTDEKAAGIRQFARDNPTMTQVDIGRHFNVNQGRVSEALRGFRT